MTTANPNLIAVGDNCLDAYLSKGFVTVGGNALNVAVQWRRHGLHARYFGALGPDAEADIMLAAIEEVGLDRNDVYLMLCFDDVKIVHCTLHVGVREAIDLITRERVGAALKRVLED